MHTHLTTLTTDQKILVTKLFIFLGKNHAKKAFLAALRNDKDRLFDRIEFALKNVSMANIIMSAFVWSGTKEGVHFWKQISDKWQTECPDEWFVF